MSIHPDISDSDEVRKLKKEIKNEKEIRIRYQNIVYKICNIVDKRKGKGSMVTVDQVVDEAKRLLRSK